MLLRLQKCFKAINLENDTARQRTPHGPATGRGPVVVDHCPIGFTMLNNDLYRMRSGNIPLLETWVNRPTMLLAHMLIPLHQCKLQFLRQKNPYIPIYYLGWKDVWSFISIHEIAISYYFRLKTSVNKNLTGLMAFLIRRICRILQKQFPYDNKYMWILALTMFEQHPHVVEELKYWLGLIGSTITNAEPTA